MAQKRNYIKRVGNAYIVDYENATPQEIAKAESLARVNGLELKAKKRVSASQSKKASDWSRELHDMDKAMGDYFDSLMAEKITANGKEKKKYTLFQAVSIVKKDSKYKKYFGESKSNEADTPKADK